jgi:hypothetical protein
LTDTTPRGGGEEPGGATLQSCTCGWRPSVTARRTASATRPEVATRAFWSVDRLHPSELGHRALARAYADLLGGAGLAFEPPSPEPEGGHDPGWRRDVAWMITEGAPWVGRRARDLGPWAVRTALSEVSHGRTRVGA